VKSGPTPQPFDQRCRAAAGLTHEGRGGQGRGDPGVAGDTVLARYVLAADIEAWRAQGWRVSLFGAHHGLAGYALAVREVAP
jgi:hypothetical protein